MMRATRSLGPFWQATARSVHKCVGSAALPMAFRFFSTQNPATVDELEKTRRFHRNVIAGVRAADFKVLTPVQQESLLPIMDEEKGLVVRAKTGTGKTLAFVLPLLQAAIESTQGQGRKKVSSLVIAPTRDLAMQIMDEFFKVSRSFPRAFKGKHVPVEILIGGKKTHLNRQNPPAIVIATPGKLEDNLGRPAVAALFSDLQYRIYDEADRILDQGFEESLTNINQSLMEARATEKPLKSVLFSATVDDAVSLFACETLGSDYKFINCVNENEPEAHENIHQVLVSTGSIYESFNGALGYIARNMSDSGFKAIVFLPTIKITDWYYDLVMAAKYKNFSSRGAAERQGTAEASSVETTSKSPSVQVYKLHGGMTQNARDRTLREFRRAPGGVLVCTDVAARGLDLKDVSDVIQMGPSVSIADYIHKIGRTARAGKKGKATIFVSDYEAKFITQLERERDVKFAETLRYEDINDGDYFNRVGIDELSVVDFMDGFLNFHKQLLSIYRFPRDKFLPQVVGFYRALVQDQHAKLRASPKYLQMSGFSTQDVRRYFQATGFKRPTNNRQSKKTFYDGGRKGDRRFLK